MVHGSVENVVFKLKYRISSKKIELTEKNGANLPEIGQMTDTKF